MIISDLCDEYAVLVSFLVYKKHGILIMTKKGMMINRH